MPSKSKDNYFICEIGTLMCVIACCIEKRNCHAFVRIFVRFLDFLDSSFALAPALAL
jgi:hypothetical protein